MKTTLKFRRAFPTIVSAILLIVGLASCGSDSLGKQARFAFTVGDADIAAYTVNPGTGALTAVSGSPFGTLFAASPCPDFATADPKHKFLVVPDPCNDNLVVAKIDPTTGAVTAVTGSPFLTGTGNFSVEQPAITPSGKFLYVGEDSPGDVVGYSLGADGTLAKIPGSPFMAGGGDEGILMDPAGKFLYAADSKNSTVSVFSIDATTGVLTAVAGSPFALTDVPKFMVIEPTGKFMYVSAPDANNVLVLSISSTGALTAVTGSPVASGGPNPGGLAVSPDGKFLFLANNGDIDTATAGNVAAFSINASTGALTAVTGSPFTAGSNPKRMAIDPASKYLYVTNEDAGNMSVFSIAKGTGVLTPVSGSPFTTNVGSEGVFITSK